MKTQNKIALLLISSNLLIILFFGGCIYVLLYNYSFEDFYKRLKTRATIAAQYKFDSDRVNAESFKSIREKHFEKLEQEKEYFIKYEDGIILEELSRTTKFQRNFLQAIIRNDVGYDNLDNVFYAGIRYKYFDKHYLVIVSAKNYFASHHLAFIRNIIIVAVFLFIAISTYLSFYFSKRIFQPIKSITEKVKRISSENIHLRIEAKDHDKELSQLISTFNDLLNRLETAFAIQNNFISNASHEFSTPLTAIMGEAEVMLMKDRTIHEYKYSLNNILEQSERLNEITKTLLFLAETGYSTKIIDTEIIRSDELVWEAKNIVNKLNPHNHIQVDMSLLPENPMKLKIRGNKSLLIVAITNILTNACKYSNNNNVIISLASSDEHVFIIVKDYGIGIPDSEIPFIYDPFFRASNTHKFEGYGIGLPLCRNIIKLHKGSLNINSKVGIGTTVEMKFYQAIVSI
jgi:signal transduction histidine kinase